jgi:CRISPR-associated protein Cmr5
MATPPPNFAKMHRERAKEKAALAQQTQAQTRKSAQAAASRLAQPAAVISLAQARAQNALSAIQRLAALPEAPGAYGNYVGYVKALPTNIRSLGLGQALAFLLSKAASERKPPAHELLTTPHGLLYAHVTAWLASRRIYDGDISPGNFMDRLVNGDQERYLSAQIEAMAYLDWLKKFAVALLEQPKESDQ